MATEADNRRLAQLSSNAPNKAAQPNLKYTYMPSTQAQYGMTPGAAMVKPLSTPGPSIGDRVGSFLKTITPGSMDAGYGKNLYRFGEVAYNAIKSTVKNANKAGKFISDAQQLTNVSLPGIATNLANIGETKRKYEAATKFVDDFKYVQQSNEDARRQLQAGAINRKEYSDIIKENTKNLITTSGQVISDESPKNINEAIDVIDGMVTLATLGTYTAARAGVGTAYKMAPKKTILESIAKIASKSKAATSDITTAQRLEGIVDKAIINSPIVRRNYETMLRRMGTSQTNVGLAKNVLAQVAFYAPLRRENLRFTADMIQDFREQKYFADDDMMGAIPSAVLTASMLLEGGPIGALARNFQKLGKVTKTAMYGEQQLLDLTSVALQKKGMKGNLIAGIYDYLNTAPKEIAKDGKLLIQKIVGTNLSKGSSQRMAQVIADHIDEVFTNSGKPLNTVTAKEVAENMIKHAYAQSLLDDFNAQGLKYVATKYSIQDQNQLIKKIQTAINKAKAEIEKLPKGSTARLEARKEIARQVVLQEAQRNVAWAQNQDIVNIILKKIDDVTTTGKSGILSLIYSPKAVNANELAKGVDSKVKLQLKKLHYVITESDSPGYTPQISKEIAEQVSLRSQFVPVDDQLFQQAATSKPVFRSLGAGLTRAGFGLDDSAQLAYKFVRDNSVDNIDNIEGMPKGWGRKILNAMQQWGEIPDNNRFADFGSLGRTGRMQKRITTDLRMMSDSQIKDALSTLDGLPKLTDKQIKGIRASIIKAHADVPLQVIGMADYLIAKSYKYNPFYKTYAKLQGAARYTYNPFFAVQEAAETELLGQALVPGKTPYIAGMGKIFPGTKAELDDIVKQIDEAGFFNDSTLTSTKLGQSLMATRFGEGAQDVYLGRVSAVITDSQKRSLAAAVKGIADRMGLSVDEAIRTHGAMIEDIVRPIVQYPTKGALNSNLAKAMNIAVFPSRYNAKVATIAVKALAQAPPAVQLLTVNKLWEMENWLKSPEGLVWQQEHNTAIQFFKWLTPIGNIQWVFDVLNSGVDTVGKAVGRAPTGNITSVGDFGLIGGLPFGVISQILQSQGIISINAPYVSPKDGEIWARKIPESMRARVASAFMDLLGSTFTYPGATIGLTNLGLPSKSQLLRGAAQKISLGTKSNEWQNQEYTPMDLSAQDKLRQEIWSNNYDVEEKAKESKPPKLEVPTHSMPKPIPTGKVMSKTELNELKKQQKAAKAAAAKAKADAKKAAKTKAKTTTFPSYLPQ
jgi:hypothetical protein